jgi:glycerol-3-phosphate acyltransferase PlsY
VGAITALLAFPIFAAFGIPNWLGVHSWTYIYSAAIVAFIVVVQHRDNIQRLLRGEERKLGESVSVRTEMEAGDPRD